MPQSSANSVPAASLIQRLDSILLRLDPAKMFAVPQPFEIELGSGDGSFLVNYAKLHPEINFIGVERLLGRLRKLDKKARRNQLTNVSGLRIESAYLLQYLIPIASANAVHVYFPDPWPKRKHRKNRLINSSFPAIAHQALKPDGLVYLRTDDRNYFEQMLEIFAASPWFKTIETPAELSAVVTDFERNFHLRGVPTLSAAYQKVSKPA